MARWVKSHQQMQIFKTASAPTVLDGLKVGDLWVDITSGAVLKVCIAVGPVVFNIVNAADVNGNVSADNFLTGYTTTATAAATTTLTVTSTQNQIFTGSTTQTVVMPAVSTLALGTSYTIVNLSSGVVTVQSSGMNTVQAMQANSTLTLLSNATSGTGATVWTVVGYMPAASSQTGSGSLVRATSPALVTPDIGAATGTSLVTSGAIRSTGSALISGTATGSADPGLILYSPTSGQGFMYFVPVDNSGNRFLIISNAPMGQSTTLTIPDTTASTASFLLSKSAATQHIETQSWQIDAGALISGKSTGSSAGSLILFSPTSAKGVINLVCNDSASNYSIDIGNASYGQSSTLTIPDPGASTASFLLSKGANATDKIVYTKASGAESSNAITLNGNAGIITTSSLTTAASGSYVITWTNSAITTTSVISLTNHGGTNTTEDISFKVVPGSGSAVLTIYNNTLITTALNGTILIGYVVN